MVESDNPLVSIIIPSFNQGCFIRDTIESCLAQDYRPLEVIIIDGASTDGTVEILREYDGTREIRWLSEKDSGVVEAVNKGFDLARGEIAGIQSSDDVYLPGAFAQAVREFSGYPELGIVYGDVVYADANGRELRRQQTGAYSLEQFLCANTLILQPATFFRMSLARAVGGWDNEYYIADTEMWLRMLFRAEAKKVDSFWGLRRIHGAQRNVQAARIVKSYFQMVEASPEIRTASRRLRRAARCGKYMIASAYNPSGSAVARRYYLWRALLAFPDVSKNGTIINRLVPGYWKLKRLATRLHRAGGKVGRLWPRGE